MPQEMKTFRIIIEEELYPHPEDTEVELEFEYDGYDDPYTNN